ncbi:response regulator transcription factor [Halobacteriovorax sp. HLS]|uniref:response regulator transcription factor n=1 Tax=Halobacteriovorax sp. HLS TaxID=2234000 RepID=UPI000FDA2577|nr:response regulator [Halobacteriovorax sp. HLS]
MEHRILIVDDSQEIHELYKKLIKKMNESELGMTFSLDHCYQGEVAVLRVREAHKLQNPYSLVLMDVRMPPGIDGIETIQMIQKDYPLTEFLVCTSFQKYDFDTLFKKFGATDRILYVHKPYNPTTIKQLTLYVASKYARENL